MKQYTTIPALFVMLLLINACGNHSAIDDNSANEKDHLIQITQKQIASEGIEMGEPSNRIFDEHITCNGYIMAPSDGIAQISTPLSGIVKNINCSLGDFVKKGEVLCSITSNELITFQQDFAEISARLSRLRADYERNKILYDEKIGAEKDFLAAESEYNAMTAKFHALKIRLELMGLDVSKIEKGNMYSSFPVVAPIKGYITNLNLVLGQFAEQQKSLMEIVDVNKLQLKLFVYQEDMSKLIPGQNISFKSLGDQNSLHSATLLSTGKSIDPETKTIQCLARIKNDDGTDFINQSYIEAQVIVNQSEVRALPTEAVLKSEKDYFVFVVDKVDKEVYYIRKVKVSVGRVFKEFSEITEGNITGKVLINGVYNLQSKLE